MHASSAFDGREVCRIQRIYQLHTARATQRNGRPQSVFCSLCSVANQPTKPCPRRFRLCGVSFPRYLSLVARRWPHPRRLRGILARLSPSGEPAQHRRTFPIRDSRSKQGHAFANRSSRRWRLLEEEKNRLCSSPGYEQKAAGRYSQHDKRPEMMIIGLSAQWAFLLHHEYCWPTNP